MRRLFSGLGLLLLLSTFFVSIPVQAQESYQIIGNSVQVDNSLGTIKVTPHTLSSSGWVEVEFQSKSFTGSVDISLGFSGVDGVQTNSVSSYESYEHTLTQTVDVIKIGTYTPKALTSLKIITTPTKAELGDLSLNQNYAEISTDNGTKTIAYSNYDTKTNTFTYNYSTKETQSYKETFPDWKPSSTTSLTNYESFGSKKWNSTSKIVSKDVFYKTKFWVDIPFNSGGKISGKYNVLIKPSSLPLANAIISGQYILLDPWYNASWTYRKSIVIAHTADGAQTNYQMKLLVGESSGAVGENVDCNSHCQSDFDDLIFTKSDGSTVLHYWIESTSGASPNGLATVWIEIDTIAAHPDDTTIYLYYGNVGASAYSNGANTFPFFDDFSGDESKWTDDGGIAVVSGGVMTVTGVGHWHSVISDTNVGANVALRSNVNLSTRGDSGFALMTTAETHRAAVYKGSEAYTWIQSKDGTTQSNLASNFTLSSYRIMDICVVGGNHIHVFDNGVECTNSPKATNPPNSSSLRIIINTTCTGVWAIVDWILCRNYTSNEPTWGSFGSEEGIPTVYTTAASSVEETTATIGGNVFNVSASNVTIRGVEYDTDSGAPYANDWHEHGDWGAGSYTTGLVGLTKGELYYFRAYATNPAGTGYGDEARFITKPDEPNTFTAVVSASGTIKLDWVKGTGAGNTTIRGKIGAYPANIADGSAIYDSTGVTYNHSGLTGGDVWYYRAWSKTSEGGLGQTSDTYAQVFCTALVTPTIYTTAAASVEETTATVGGNIFDTGGVNNTIRGVEYDTDSGAPYANDWHEHGSYGTGTYTNGLVGLTKGELYYFRAYGTNTVGTGYGAEARFITKPDEPNTFTAVPNGFGVIKLDWIKGSGAGNTTIRGKIGAYPANIADGVAVYDSTLQTYSHSGLGAGEHWFYRAWSKASEGGLGQVSDTYDEADATTVDTPDVSTKFCSGFSKTTAILVGDITDLGGSATGITQRGFEWGLTTAYGSETLTTGSYGLGEYSTSITGLNPATVYHFRAKVKNSDGIWGTGGDRAFATKGSPVIYENWQTGNQTSFEIYSGEWAYQTFVTNSTSIPHTVTSIWLYVSGNTSLGDVTVSLRRTNAGVPTGDDLVSTTVDGALISTALTWYHFDIDEYALEANTKYAIVVRAPLALASSHMHWYWASGGGDLYGGNAGHTHNSGTSWTSDAPADYLYQLWGNPALQVEDAKVFSTYINTDDWLITVLYKNIYPPFYEEGRPVSSYFYLQLVEGSTVLAQTKCAQWGYVPGSIYLSASMVAPLTWGSTAYKVRLYGDFVHNATSYPYAEYAITAVDWRGTDLTLLDTWVRTTATMIETYSGTTLTTYVAGRGLCLNNTGSSLFINGINDLDHVRPDLFSITSTEASLEENDYTQAYQPELAWQTFLGPTITKMFTDLGNQFQLDGAVIGMLLAFLFYAGMAAVAFTPGHAVAAIVIPIPFIIAAVYVGVIGLVVMGVICCFASVFLIKQMWWDKA